MYKTQSQTVLLHKMNPLSRFSGRAADYANYRPSYPKEAIARILEGLDSSSQLLAADIGAGTGIASRLLANQGVRVFAIEPNDEMRQAASPHPLVEFRKGTAENTTLPTGSVDLVASFQAFHWFSPTPTLTEFRRILKPTGRLALIWNDLDRNDELTASYSHLVDTVTTQKRLKPLSKSANSLLESPDFDNVVSYEFAYRHELNLSQFVGHARSVSFIPYEEFAQQKFIDGLQEIYDRFCDENGKVCMVYCTSVYTAKAST
jgi:SAM-dependent methyltransferase